MEIQLSNSFFKKNCQRVGGELNQNMQLQDLGKFCKHDLHCYDSIDVKENQMTFKQVLKRDESYAALLACCKEDLASSHAVKRFFAKFSFT